MHCCFLFILISKWSRDEMLFTQQMDSRKWSMESRVTQRKTFRETQLILIEMPKINSRVVHSAEVHELSNYFLFIYWIECHFSATQREKVQLLTKVISRTAVVLQMNKFPIEQWRAWYIQSYVNRWNYGGFVTFKWICIIQNNR